MHLVVGIIHAFGHITAIAILATALVFMARGSHYSSVQGNELTDKPVRIASYVITGCALALHVGLLAALAWTRAVQPAHIKTRVWLHIIALGVVVSVPAFSLQGYRPEDGEWCDQPAREHGHRPPGADCRSPEELSLTENPFMLAGILQIVISVMHLFWSISGCVSSKREKKRAKLAKKSIN